ncbi:hypothetical protein MRX96_001112 [Rhipicephalus microplus]
MNHLRRSRGIVRATTTRIIMSATEALQAENPTLADLQVMNDLQDKDVTLDDFNERIADLIINDTESVEEMMAALQYHDKICNIMSRVRCIFNSVSRPAGSNAPVVAIITEHQEVSAQESSQSPLRVALLKVPVPVFSGELRKWQGTAGLL